MQSTLVHVILGYCSGWMISGFQDEVSGFGMPMTPDRLKQANEHERWQGKSPLVESPGVRGLVFGKNADGYWNSQTMLSHLEAHLHCASLRYADFQILYYFDWSSGHAAMPPGGLHAPSMNATYGGKQKAMRPTKILAEKGYLGAYSHDSMLKVGDVQHMVFQPNDPPPFYEPQAQDYVGKPKGLRQVLWERGLLNTQDPPVLKEQRKILGNCLDFLHEETALSQHVHAKGHLLIMTPKAHPELAGVGIEYSWGKSKMHFRKVNDCNSKTFHSQVGFVLSADILYETSCCSTFRSYRLNFCLSLSRTRNCRFSSLCHATCCRWRE